MQVNCPNCGAKVPAEHINIQKMAAVCPACDTVFPFDVSDAKAKRRKTKQPEKLTLRDAETLHMEFWTNFRLDSNEAVVLGSIGGGGMSFMALLMLATGEVPLLIPLMFLGIALFFFYLIALTVVNKTHIDMDESAIRITRKPLPNLFNQGDEVSLAGVTAIKYEETAISKKEGYDTPRYRVWAETADGSRRTIVNDVTEDYAVFIAQRLEERLHMDTSVDIDVSRLEEVEHDLDDADVEVHEMLRASQNNVRR
jgi:hypothetical protein